MPPPPVTSTFDRLTLKVVSESHVTWASCVPILVFLGHFVLDLGPMYATDSQTSNRRQTASSLNAPAYRGGGIIIRKDTFTFFILEKKKKSSSLLCPVLCVQLICFNHSSTIVHNVTKDAATFIDVPILAAEYVLWREDQRSNNCYGQAAGFHTSKTVRITTIKLLYNCCLLQL